MAGYADVHDGDTSLDSFDLLIAGERLERRFAATVTEFSARGSLDEEVTWLEQGRQRLERKLAGTADLRMRALHLPELESLRADHGRGLQEAALDAVDELHVAIRKAVGERSPVIDVLYMNLKLVTVRTAKSAAFAEFCDEFERRIGTSYLTRMFADESYLPAGPALDEVKRRFAEWRALFAAEPMPEVEAAALRLELRDAAARLERAQKQALLLADAAFMSAEDLRAGSTLFEKAKRKTLRR